MYRLSGFLLSLIWLLYACNAQQQSQSAKHDSHAYTNKLINSSSPYLLQHAHNPVDWYPWGEEALEKARDEDKLLIISVGYAACHWCHVMERESFEDTAVARLMNEHFVAIKVDREERPDVDQIYMNVAEMTTGNGGWPLNAIAMPDGRPLFAATYFPKENWLRLLNTFIRYKSDKPDELEKAATELTKGVQSLDVQEFVPFESAFDQSHEQKIQQELLALMDLTKGGLDKAPKFPMPSLHQLLLRLYYHGEEEKSLTAIKASLDEMMRGGIYDQVGGGFARYSTDAEWKVPHFEKMLYDNGQLMSLYSDAYALLKDEAYKRVVYETADFLEREMRHEEGAFFSSLDADSEGEEGKFYVWSAAEIEEVLGKEAAQFKSIFEIKENGNWEAGKNILYTRQSVAAWAEQLGLSTESLLDQLNTQKAKLLKAREKRVRPGLDDKVLTAWNGLAIRGYLDAYQAFGDERFLNVARENAAFLKKYMFRKDGGLNRNFKSEASTINAFADDYASVIAAWISFYQATFEEQWLTEAQALMEYVLAHFNDEKSGFFFYTSDEDAALITRSKEFGDNKMPSANSSLAQSLFALGTLLYEESYLARSEQMVKNIFQDIVRQPAYYANWAQLLLAYVHQPYELAIVGADYEGHRKTMAAAYLPHVFLLGGADEGKLQLLKSKSVEGMTMLYVCQDKICKLPVTDVQKALGLIER
ncbi:MAG: thioredoxin domain-containing protein [Bacteroidota bacterium]